MSPRVPYAATALALLVAAVVAAMPAAAQQAAKPAPGCAGVATDDPAGDVTPGGGDNYDVKGLFFTYEGGRLNANIQIADLGKAVSKPGLNVRWILIYRVDDAFFYVRTLSDGTNVSYRYGTYDPTLDDFTGVADVKGAFAEGPDGVITVELPKATWKKAGATIAETFISVRETVESGAPANQTGYAPESDRAPDSGGAGDYVISPCPDVTGGTAAPPAVAVPPATTSPATGPAVLGVKAPAAGGSARKASKRKAVALRLTAAAPVTALKADLLKGNKVIGTGTLARLDRTGTVKLKLKRKLAKATYGLRISATLADGRPAQQIFRIKFTK